MNLPAKSELARVVVSAFPALGFSFLGYTDAKPWEQRAFLASAVCAAVGFVWNIYDIYKAALYIEPVLVRRRCHRVLTRIAEDIFPSDTTVEVTLFLPDTLENHPHLVPVTRFSASRREDIEPRSRSRFTPNSSTIIEQAWKEPGVLKAMDVPTAQFKNDDAARGWFQANMHVKEKEAKRLSPRTLNHVKSIANIAIRSPLIPDKRIALLALTSESAGRFSVLKPGSQEGEAFGKYTEVIASLLSPR